MVRSSVHVVWPSVLSLNNLKVLKIHTAKPVKNICLQDKIMLYEPLIQSKKTNTWSAVNFKKTCGLDEFQT